MTTDRESAFTDLLRTWNRHQDLRATGAAEVVDLAASRRRLDEARDALRRAA